MAKKETEQTEIIAPYELPEGWKWVRLGDVAKFERGITFPASAKEAEKNENNIPCLRTANVQENVDFDNLIYVNKSFMKNNAEKLVKANDIIFSSANSRELVGKSSFVYSLPFPMTFGGFILCIRPKSSDSKFLFYFLRLHFLLGRFMGKSTQTTNIANINTESLSNVIFPLPPTLDEQKRIVSRIESMFTKLDEARDKAQSVVDGFELRRAAILHKAFTGALTAKWRKENGVSDESWEEKKLEDVCSKITDGTHNSPVNTETGEFKYITAKNIKESGIDLTNITFVTKEIHQEIYSRCNVEKGDVLYIKDGATTGIATVNTLDEEFSMLSSVADIKPIKGLLDSKYLAYVMNSSEVKAKMLNEMSGNAITRLTLVKIKNAEVPICSLPEQQEIVRILDTVLEKESRAKEAAQTVLEQIAMLKKSILARAFRGEL